MADKQVMDRVKRVVAETLNVDPAKVTDGAHFINDLGMESIQSVELIAAFEEEFDIEIDSDNVSSIFTVGMSADWIQNALSK